jgi:hypothetical protein
VVFYAPLLITLLRWHCTVLHVPPEYSHVAGWHIVSAEQERPNPGRRTLHLSIITCNCVVWRELNAKCYRTHRLVCQVQLLSQCSSHMHVIHPEIWGVLGYPVQRIHHVLPTQTDLCHSINHISWDKAKGEFLNSSRNWFYWQTQIPKCVYLGVKTVC